MKQLPLISKLAERSVQIQILEHLEVNGLLSDNQHGYRKNANTTTAMLQIMDTIATNTDGNLITASLSVDQSAAFDSVEHAILLEKLEYYHLSRNTITWMDLYLRHRSNYMTIGSADSMITTAEHGVPQGSCMGPLLYLLYVNEFPEACKDDFCHNQAHNVTSKLFSGNCQDCGTLVIFADDRKYMVPTMIDIGTRS